MAILIFLLSTAILLFGALRLPRHDLGLVVIFLLSVQVFISAADVFVDGNQTILRQIGYLVEAVILSGYVLTKRVTVDD